MKAYHTPVLLKESLESLDIKPDGFYIDGTLGEAGHSLEIYKQLSEVGLLLSIDQDQRAIDFVKEKYEPKDNWILQKGNFVNIAQFINNIDRKPDGILLDIGVSSAQLEEKGRGFSYRNEDEELDMRMDTDLNVKASDLLKVLNERQLTKIFQRYGEERYSKQIAKAIKQSPSDITTVGDLTRLVYRVVPATYREGSHQHPARRVFQALRIAVNDELNTLQETIDNSFEILNLGGRFSIITFHSLEDRIVKQAFKKFVEKEDAIYPMEKFITPSEKEIESNPRSRSAKLRTIEKQLPNGKQKKKTT